MPRKKKKIFRLTYLNGALDLRNVLICAACVEVACVITGFFVYQWQQHEAEYRLSQQEAAMDGQINDLYYEIYLLKKQNGSLNPR